LPRLEAAAEELGIQLVYKVMPGATEGLSKGGIIEIEETLSITARCGVIVHELSHEILHRQNREETTRQQRELEAVSFIELESVPTRRNCRDEVRVAQREIPHQTPANFPFDARAGYSKVFLGAPLSR
jgi:hypothetical protein